MSGNGHRAVGALCVMTRLGYGNRLSGFGRVTDSDASLGQAHVSNHIHGGDKRGCEC